MMMQNDMGATKSGNLSNYPCYQLSASSVRHRVENRAWIQRSHCSHCPDNFNSSSSDLLSRDQIDYCRRSYGSQPLAIERIGERLTIYWRRERENRDDIRLPHCDTFDKASQIN